VLLLRCPVVILAAALSLHLSLLSPLSSLRHPSDAQSSDMWPFEKCRGNTYREFMSHQSINDPIPEEKHDGLCSDALGKTKQYGGCLSEAGGGETDAVLGGMWDMRVQAGGDSELRGSCEGVCEVRHVIDLLLWRKVILRRRYPGEEPENRCRYPSVLGHADCSRLRSC